ncbi:MAG: Clp protease N-terminal domain-containing protein [Bryobacteraceae bacterium]
MFERYTEIARRTIFFARYEASQFGSRYIETEHLLLGLLREDKSIANRVWPSTEVEEIRRQIESQAVAREKVSTSVDLPLSAETKQSLAFAAEESERLQHKHIDCAHMVLGLLRVETCTAAGILREHGVDYASYREVVRSTPPRPPVGSYFTQKETRAIQPRETAAPSLRAATAHLDELIDTSSNYLRNYSDVHGDQKLKRKPWTRKQALGHLIDLATTHHNWFVRAMTEPGIAASGYPGPDWVAAQQYEKLSWPDLVDLWVWLNRLLVHVVAMIPENKVKTSCRIGIEEPIALLQLIQRYIESCDDILGQILGRL